jgi:hypothetical protein
MGGGGGGGVTSTAGIGMVGNLKQSVQGWKDVLTSLGNLGFKQERWSMDEAGEMTKLANPRGVGGMKGGAMLAAGTALVMDGLRRGGKLGVADDRRRRTHRREVRRAARRGHRSHRRVRCRDGAPLHTNDKTGHSPGGFSILPGADDRSSGLPKRPDKRRGSKSPAGSESPSGKKRRTASQPLPIRIFISYRREDGAHARLIRERIRRNPQMSHAEVFLDIEAIRLGERYRSKIPDEIESCQVLIALIGREWMGQIGALRRPDDFVRFELELALKQGISIIPVAVDGKPRNRVL